MKGKRRPGIPPPDGHRFITLFVSYSHANRVWMERLKPLLVGMRYDDRAHDLVGLHEVSSWHDFELKAGDRWDKEVKDALETMDIFVPLVSAEFFASPYVMDIELPAAEERYRRQEIHIVPILLQDVNLREKCTFLSQFNPLPTFGSWWSRFRPYADAFRLIDDGLWTVVQKALKRNRSRLV